MCTDVLCVYKYVICMFVLQLLAATIQHEKPELEQRKSELLKKEEELKVQLAALEESLLQELAMAEGNILENKTLLESLNETKAKSMTIANALKESVTLQASLDKVQCFRLTWISCY